MELILKRNTFTDKSTIGELTIDDKFECYVLEDKDRGLNSEMSLDELNKLKVFGETAIPYGRYEIKVTYSNRFKKHLPILLDVKGYEGIRIHLGNTAVDTHGCLLPGKVKLVDKVADSTFAFNKLFQRIQYALLDGEVFITITK